MINNSRNVRRNRRQKNQKKKQLQKVFFLFIKLFILVVLIYCIRNMNISMKELQIKLKGLETQENGIAQTGMAVQGNTDYVESIASWDVGTPIERTDSEVLQQLSVLGQSSPLIEEIYQNNSLYPEELLKALANNPEMADFAAGYPGRESSLGGLTASEKEQDFPLFLQWDPRWGYQSYGTGSNIGLAGCGPTCLSMVLFYLTRDETLTPDRIAEYSVKNGYYVEGTGTAWALMEDVPKLYGINVTSLSLSANHMQAVLDHGSIIICSMGKGDFTTSGHYIVIYGYDGEGFLVNDPNCVARSSRRWTFHELEKQIKNIWVYDKDMK